MRRYIVLDADDLEMLLDNKPIEMKIDGTRLIVCSEGYFDKLKGKRADQEEQGNV